MKKLQDYNHVYMIGIKGVGMTALAQILKAKGLNISGSDIEEVFITDEVLKKLQIKYYNSFSKNNIPSETDLIIYSTAYGPENVEMQAALERKIDKLSYPEALGCLFNVKCGIAVAGSHGKTTTTAMLGWILIQSNVKPTVVVGSKISNLDTNAYVGNGDCMVIEADEYQNKFKYYDPKVLVVTNIDYDHPDYFKTKEEYHNTFKKFISKVAKKNGTIVSCGDDSELKHIIKLYKKHTITYGFNKSNTWVATNIYQNKNSTTFTILKNNILKGKVVIKLNGSYNVLNTLAAIATADLCGVSLTLIKKALRSFVGTSRRQEYIGQKNSVIMYDDYAHHPTEIRATLSALINKYPKQKVWAVFHPHTFTRTKVFLSQFAKSFKGVYKVIVLDIYGSARETKAVVHSKDLVKRININSQNALYIPSKEEAFLFLKQNLKKSDVIITLGAGDVWKITHKLCNKRIYD